MNHHRKEKDNYPFPVRIFSEKSTTSYIEPYDCGVLRGLILFFKGTGSSCTEDMLLIPVPLKMIRRAPGNEQVEKLCI